MQSLAPFLPIDTKLGGRVRHNGMHEKFKGPKPELKQEVSHFGLI